MHPASESSIQKEVALVQRGFGRQVVAMFWAGNLMIPSGGEFVGFSQKKVQSVDAAFAVAGSSSTSSFDLLFRAVLKLLLDILEAGYTTQDAGPRNLGILSDGRAVFINSRNPNLSSGNSRTTRPRCWN